ncbi:MAG: abortive infection family protein [Verrucomicrobiia bacterium]
MKPLPPINDAILVALAQLVDDAQTERRDPSHEQIGFCIVKAGLKHADPQAQGQPVGKAKRLRAVLSQALQDDFKAAQKLTDILISHIRGLGGFRTESQNYVGAEAIRNLQAAFANEGFVLTDDGDLTPKVLDSLSGAELTEALSAYVRRAQRGAEDAALLTGTGKDLLEATAAHVLVELWSQTNPPHNFPTLLGQAFVALAFKTSEDKPQPGESPQHELQRALFGAACAVNRLRNKQGTGHGRPWLPTVTPDEAQVAAQTMGIVSGLLLSSLRERKK